MAPVFRSLWRCVAAIDDELDLSYEPCEDMNTALNLAVAQLEDQVGAVIGLETLSDSELERRVQDIAERTLSLGLSAGGLMDRLGLFDRRRTEQGAVLLDSNTGHPRMKRMAKLTLMMLARTELWQAEQDVEVLRDSLTSARARCDAQSYRMIRWTGALLGAGLERYCDTYCELWSSVITTLHVRSSRAEDSAVKEACRSLLRVLWLEPRNRALARTVPRQILTDWVADSSDRTQASIVASALADIVQHGELDIPDLCVKAMIEGPLAVLQWAEAQLAGESLAEPCEQMMGRCVLDLLVRRFAQDDKAHLPKVFRQSGEWVTRLMKVGTEAQQAALRRMVGTHAPQWWRACVPQDSLEDPAQLCPPLKEVFSQLSAILADRFEQTIIDWIHGIVSPCLDKTLFAQLELLTWLGVRQEHADSVAGCSLRVSECLFGANHEQSGLSLSLVANWERWAPIARLLPESLVLEALAAQGGFQNHLRAIVESGHPQFAMRLLQQFGGLQTFLHDLSVEMITHLHKGGYRASWRWWAFLMAHGPRRLGLDRQKGTASSQLSFALSQVVRMTLVQGMASREADVVIAGLILRGANAHRSGGNAWGSSAEQLYVLGISGKEMHRPDYQMLQQLLQHLNRLIGHSPPAAAAPSSGGT